MKRLSAQFNSIAVKKGKMFLMDLEGNASTSYLWEVEVKSGNATALSRETLVKDPNPMLFGGGSVERTVFIANEAGTVEIEANWRRPWEKGTPPAKSHRFKVTVS